GLLRSELGRSARAALIAAWTSRAAPLMSRPMENCKLIRAEPSALADVISLTSAIWPRWRSSGVATVMATSAGLAPGRVACTEIVGMSTSGSGETGSLKNAMPPATTSPSESSVVATGRRIKGLERLIKMRSKPFSDQLLSGNSPIQKPYNVTWSRHTAAANQSLKNGRFSLHGHSKSVPADPQLVDGTWKFPELEPVRSPQVLKPNEKEQIRLTGHDLRWRADWVDRRDASPGRRCTGAQAGPVGGQDRDR